MSLNTEILSVGTELLLGHVTNTDSRDISEELSKIGINVLWHTVVGDNPGRLEECINIAKSRADIIITTGGLGPTCDDLTKQIAAKAFGLELVRDSAEFEGLHDYIKPGVRFTENNIRQAYVPEGSTVFHNSCGTAPGCVFEKDGKIVAMLPGPPKECRTMLRRSLIPYLKRLNNETIVSHSVNIFGIGESRVDDMFADEMNAMTNPSMAPYAKECDCLVQITAKAASEAEAEEMMQPVLEHVKSRLGEYVYGTDVENLEQSVLALLGEKRFALAESLTGGDVARRFTDLPGSEKNFAGGIVNPHFPNGSEAAARLAESIRENFGADFGISVVGEEKTVFVGLATADETFVREADLGMRTDRSRSFIRTMSGNHAYDMLRRYLTGLHVI